MAALDRPAVDPSKSYSIREKEFRPALTGRLEELRAAVSKTVGYDNDALHLKRDAPEKPGQQIFAAREDIDPTRNFVFETDAEAVDSFLDWFDQQVENGVLEVIPRQEVRNGQHFTATYVRSASRRGVEVAGQNLRQSGFDVTDEQLNEAFNAPVSKEALGMAYTRTYGDLKTVTDGMTTAVRRTLTQGLADGVNPRVMARRLRERIDVSITDAERLARTETLNVLNEQALNTYERFGVEEVSAKVEIQTAEDERVCSRCKAYKSDGPFKIGEARGGLPRHPQCRCCWVPVVDTSATSRSTATARLANQPSQAIREAQGTRA